MRPDPKFSPPKIETRPTDQTTEVRSYQLITPLYGGGVEPSKCDEVTVVRATEIRGHLRFWWRATQGGRFDGDLKKMKAAEDALWGAAGGEGDTQPSKVQVVVINSNPGKPFQVNDFNGKKIDISDFKSPYSYAAFPLRDQGQKDLPNEIKFTLKLTFPGDAKKEIEAALWAWETFGGLGARTRRGFGAIRLEKIEGVEVKPRALNQLVQTLKNEMEQHVVAGTWPKGVPYIGRQTFPSHIQVTAPQPTPVKAWEQLIRKLKNFRQQRNPGNNPPMPGRSHWPEPDEIRRLTRRSDPNHRNPLWNVSKFPRAAFGLPIIFHFKDRSDPGDTTLQGTVSDRLASPLILRPLMCADGKTVGLAFVLSGPREPDGGLILKGAPGDPPVLSTLSPTDAAKLKPLNGQTDVLQAFLKFLTQ